MPALKNAKHERFAQGLAKGKTQAQAYADAGYAGDETAACRLSKNVKVSDRVAEILEHAATRAEITVAAITERMLKIADKAEVSTEAPLLSVARATLMDVAKLNGLITDKREISGELGIRTLADFYGSPDEADTEGDA